MRFGNYQLIQTAAGVEIHQGGQKLTQVETLELARQEAGRLTLAQIQPGTRFRNVYNPDVIETAQEIVGESVYIVGHPFGYRPEDIGEILETVSLSPAGPTAAPTHKQVSFL